MKIHKLDIVHQDFHPGNILSSNFKDHVYISDFGLRKLIEIILKKNVLPYIAPEVLSGGEEYIKAADLRAMKYTMDYYMRCWDSRVTHRPTFEELEELYKYWEDYNNYLISANQESTNTTTTTITPLNYKTHPQAIYIGRLLNFSNLQKPKNEENFERELEELTKSRSNLCPSNSDLFI
ncbi:hypothetical protein Glove_355g24 [Diversispora epigaea]|uniref:Protein kinase domain-containing protein n=1 Tax=Diversispora epigaea TaxID=1348612 RepID=A0A397HB15_9GLOM|nr:hypothetical protein Glove_355g24 [Diversispora epigaea]